MQKEISHTLRFAILKRDLFTCRYCGASAPQAHVEVEHIVPLKQGGNNKPEDLITSCRPCNRGKGTKLLRDRLTGIDDFSIIEARHNHLIATTQASLAYEQHLQSLALELDTYWWTTLAQTGDYAWSEPVLAIFRHLLRSVDIATLKECMALAYDTHKNPNSIKPFYNLAWREIGRNDE